MGRLRAFAGYVWPNGLSRYNLYLSSDILGNVAKGYTTGEAIGEIEAIAARVLPPGMGIEWTDIAYEEKKAGNTSVYIFAICAIFVFLLLSALYESWTIPLSVILIVPLGDFLRAARINYRWIRQRPHGANRLRGVKRACVKNAILIVEFAKQREDKGETLQHALAAASQNRLRPIMMTSFAFIFGVVPLAYGMGPGCELRQPLGTSVMFGMVGVTLLGCIMTPVFYYIVRRIFGHPKLEK